MSGGGFLSCFGRNPKVSTQVWNMVHCNLVWNQHVKAAYESNRAYGKIPEFCDAFMKSMRTKVSREYASCKEVNMQRLQAPNFNPIDELVKHEWFLEALKKAETLENEADESCDMSEFSQIFPSAMAGISDPDAA